MTETDLFTNYPDYSAFKMSDADKAKAYKKLYDTRLKQGICVNCGDNPKWVHGFCEQCARANLDRIPPVFEPPQIY